MRAVDAYPVLKILHVACVITSGSLFTLRGIAVLRGWSWGNHPPLRRLTYAIDTVLLVCGVLLMFALRIHPGNQPWLAVKLLLLVAYIVLGVFALRRARTAPGRWLSFLAALAVFACMVGVARTHLPLGWLTVLP